MFERLLALFERFVVAHEALAFGTSSPKAGGGAVKAATSEKEDTTAETPAKKTPAKKTRGKKETAKAGPDLASLRAKIKEMAAAIANGEDDECADKFDDLLEDYNVRTVTKLTDDDVEEFHDEVKALIDEYYDVAE